MSAHVKPSFYFDERCPSEPLTRCAPDMLHLHCRLPCIIDDDLTLAGLDRRTKMDME